MSWQNQAQFTKQSGFNRQLQPARLPLSSIENHFQQRQARLDWVKYRLLNQEVFYS